MEGDSTAILRKISAASEQIAASDSALHTRIDGVEKTLNGVMRQIGRPGGGWEMADADIAERKDAIGLCHTRRALTVPKIDGGVTDDYVPSSSEIDEAMMVGRALKVLYRHPDMARLEPGFQKSLSAFSFNNSGLLLPPETSNQVLRCVTDPTDVSGMVSSVNISAGSIKFPIDNSRMHLAGWSCDASCFASNRRLTFKLASANLRSRLSPSASSLV